MTEAAALLVELPELAGATLGPRLGRGPSSDSWRLQRGAQALVLRMDRPLVKALGLSRANEVRCQQRAAQQQLAPQLVFADPERGILVSHYVPEPTIHAEARRAPAYLRKVGRLLAAVHAIKAADLPAMDLPAMLNRYATCAGTPVADRRARSLSDQARDLYRDAPWCLCHHDPHLLNVRAARCLIDWEYAALGDPLFDLAALLAQESLTDEARAALFEGWGQPIDGPRLAEFSVLYQGVAELWEAAISAAS